jgi:hypothetical protein
MAGLSVFIVLVLVLVLERRYALLFRAFLRTMDPPTLHFVPAEPTLEDDDEDEYEDDFDYSNNPTADSAAFTTLPDRRN